MSGRYRRDDLRHLSDDELAYALAETKLRGTDGFADRLKLEAEVRARFRKTGVRIRPLPLDTLSPETKSAAASRSPPSSYELQRSSDAKLDELRKIALSQGAEGYNTLLRIESEQRSRRAEQYASQVDPETIDRAVAHSWRKSFYIGRPNLVTGSTIVLTPLIGLLGGLFLLIGGFVFLNDFGQSANRSAVVLIFALIITAIGVGALAFAFSKPPRPIRHVDFLDLG